MRVQRTVAMTSVVTMAMSVATGRRAPLSVTGDRARLSGVSPLPIRPFEIRGWLRNDSGMYQYTVQTT